jgi:cysteine protease ATG4
MINFFFFFENIISLLFLFHHPGVVGGKPRLSLFFVALQDQSLYYLDPHTTQDCVSSDSGIVEIDEGNIFKNLLNDSYQTDKSSEDPYPDPVDISSYFQKKVLRIDMKNVDPSMMLCFLFMDRDEFDNFCKSVKHNASLITYLGIIN